MEILDIDDDRKVPRLRNPPVPHGDVLYPGGAQRRST